MATGAEDESVINSALILHLDSAADLLLPNQPNMCEWVLNRVDLRARFRPGEHGGYTYTARVDGVLWTFKDTHAQLLTSLAKPSRQKTK